MTTDLMLAGLLQGLILAIIAYGIMIPFRFLNFPDLSAEGAYPLGGAIYAACVSMHISPLGALAFAMLGAGIMCIVTSLIHLRLKVNTLLAGIILSTMAYSVNLRVLGKPNIALFDAATVFCSNTAINIAIITLALVASVLGFGLFLRTDFGLRLRAVGINPCFAGKYGISISKYTILGLFLAGLLFGLAGGVMVQLQHYMDVGMGAGVVIHALASLMLGEAIIGTHTINNQLLAPLIGALLYQQIQGLALACGLAPSDLKLFTGCMVLAVIALQKGGAHASR